MFAKKISNRNIIIAIPLCGTKDFSEASEFRSSDYIKRC